MVIEYYFGLVLLFISVEKYICSKENLQTKINVTDIYPDGFHESYVGYIPISKTPNGSYIFYQLFSAFKTNINDSSKPLILWLAGGPGCSSMFGAYIEMGPYFIERKSTKNSSNLTLVHNKMSWTMDAHMVFVDSPIGVGYSLNGSIDQPNNTMTAALDFEKFLIGFFKTYPELNQSPLYIFSESYGGHYVIKYKFGNSSYFSVKTKNIFS